MSKILMINGSPRKKGGTSAAFAAIRQGMEAVGAEVHTYSLNELQFQGCQGCKRSFGCVLQDGLSPVLDELETADGLVLGSPVYMFAVSGQTKLFLNRLYCLIDAGYRPYAGRMRRLMTVYAMGSPSDGAVRSEETRMAQAMQMLGFRETERILVTSVFPGQSPVRLSAGSREEFARRARRWAQR